MGALTRSVARGCWGAFSGSGSGDGWCSGGAGRGRVGGQCAVGACPGQFGAVGGGTTAGGELPEVGEPLIKMRALYRFFCIVNTLVSGSGFAAAN